MHKIDYFSHNWLAIKNNNETFKDNLFRFRGIVYDLGCGIRPYEQDVLHKCDQYIGVDWGNTHHKLKANIISDLNKPLPIESNSADLVTSFQVLEHLSEPQIFLNEAYRILKNNGEIFLTVPFQWWMHEAPYDYFRYTRYGLKYLFEKAGFRDIEIKANSGFFTMWLLKINYFSLRAIKGPKFLQHLLKIPLIPIWFTVQKLAPFLDKLDKNWELETGAFTVVARKG